jgi:hypothetical protein
MTIVSFTAVPADISMSANRRIRGSAERSDEEPLDVRNDRLRIGARHVFDLRAMFYRPPAWEGRPGGAAQSKTAQSRSDGITSPHQIPPHTREDELKK